MENIAKKLVAVRVMEEDYIELRKHLMGKMSFSTWVRYMITAQLEAAAEERGE